MSQIAGLLNDPLAHKVLLIPLASLPFNAHAAPHRPRSQGVIGDRSTYAGDGSGGGTGRHIHVWVAPVGMIEDIGPGEFQPELRGARVLSSTLSITLHSKRHDTGRKAVGEGF
jgi:hypothetical protein